MTRDEKYTKAAAIISGAGGTPLPVTETLLSILKLIIAEDELDVVLAFKDQKSQTLEQLQGSSGLAAEEIERQATSLAKKGVIFNQPSSKGIMVYRLCPMVNVGIFEYTFMGKLEINERTKKIAALFDALFAETKILIAKNYDNLKPLMMSAPPVDRTVPVFANKQTSKKVRIEINQELGAPEERILPTQRVEELIEKFDEIAVGHCFCRHHKDISGQPCEQTNERENCFTFGKSARYTTAQGFARMVTKQEALDILKRAEESGLVHKAYHPNFNTSKPETSVCNCCKCCCGNSVKNQIAGPIINVTNYLAKVDEDLCTGCGTCLEKCHTDATFLQDNGTAGRKQELCIGCGVCSYFCPENAISLIEGERVIRILPPRN